MPDLRNPRHLAALFFVGLFLVVWGGLLLWKGPSAIVDLIGVENAYLVIFLLAISGGLSSFTSAPYYAALLTFAAGGADPLLLGLIAGLSISIGDMLVFTLGRVAFAESRLKDHWLVVKIKALLARAPRWGVPGLIVLYTLFTPFPNDVLMVSLGTLKERPLVVAPWLALGNTLQMVAVTHGVAYSIAFLEWFA